LSLLAELMGSLFVLIKYLGGAYLIFLGLSLYRSKPKDLGYEIVAKSSLLSSFLTGLLITLADQKATLFYLGFFPAFVEVSKLSSVDIGLILVITTVAVGGVKLMYAVMADRARFLLKSRFSQRINQIAGIVMIAVGVFLILRQ
jgi:threonine/homoserine/homoserine lactone efflux protein